MPRIETIINEQKYDIEISKKTYKMFEDRYPNFPKEKLIEIIIRESIEENE